MNPESKKCLSLAKRVKQLHESRDSNEMKLFLARYIAMEARTEAANAALELIAEYTGKHSRKQSLAWQARNAKLIDAPDFNASWFANARSTHARDGPWLLAGTALMIADALQDRDGDDRFSEPLNGPLHRFTEIFMCCLRACPTSASSMKLLRTFSNTSHLTNDEEESDNSLPSLLELWDQLEVEFRDTELGKELKDKVMKATVATVEGYELDQDLYDVKRNHTMSMIGYHFGMSLFV